MRGEELECTRCRIPYVAKLSSSGCELSPALNEEKLYSLNNQSVAGRLAWRIRSMGPWPTVRHTHATPFCPQRRVTDREVCLLFPNPALQLYPRNAKAASQSLLTIHFRLNVARGMTWLHGRYVSERCLYAGVPLHITFCLSQYAQAAQLDYWYSPFSLHFSTSEMNICSLWLNWARIFWSLSIFASQVQHPDVFMISLWQMVSSQIQLDRSIPAIVPNTVIVQTSFIDDVTSQLEVGQYLNAVNLNHSGK